MALNQALVVLFISVPLYLLVPLTEAKPVFFQYCSGASADVVKVREVDIERALMRGLNATIKITASTDQLIPDARLQISSVMGDIMIVYLDAELCKPAAAITTCPVSVGDFVITATFPASASTGTAIHVTIVDSDSNPLTCIILRTSLIDTVDPN